MHLPDRYRVRKASVQERGVTVRETLYAALRDLAFCTQQGSLSREGLLPKFVFRQVFLAVMWRNSQRCLARDHIRD